MERSEALTAADAERPLHASARDGDGSSTSHAATPLDDRLPSSGAASTALQDDSAAQDAARRHHHQTQAQMLRTAATRVPRAPARTASASTSTAVSDASAPLAVATSAHARPIAARKPPLATTTPTAATAKKPYTKRRERDFPDVEWDQSIHNFAKCVRLELDELNDAFVANVRA